MKNLLVALLAIVILGISATPTIYNSDNPTEDKVCVSPVTVYENEDLADPLSYDMPYPDNRVVLSDIDETVGELIESGIPENMIQTVENYDKQGHRLIHFVIRK